MASNTRLSELKHEILRLLKEDEEFRYAIAGLIGLDIVISELKELKKAILDNSIAIKKLQEVIAEHGKDIKELQKTAAEHSKAIKELQEAVAEHSKAIKELQKVVVEHSKVIAEHSKAIRELQQVVAEHSRAIKGLQEEMIRFRASVYAIGSGYGVVAEEAFRSAIGYLVEDLLKEYRVERWVYYDDRGAVYGAPSLIEVDVLVRDREHILIEYKVHVDKSDVSEFERVAKLYEEVVGVKPRKLIVGASVTEKAVELAKSLGIEVRAGNIYKK